MKTIIQSRSWLAFLALPLLLLLPIWGQTEANNGASRYALRPPAFVGTAYAAPANDALDTILNEAGTAAYFDAGTTVSISSVRGAFTTIELESSDYILGSVALANYRETESPHVYVHRDGWFMAYYLNTDPAAKIIDWRVYADSGDTVLSTKLENVLADVAGLAGVGATNITHYDFRYPNATTMMLIAERDQGANNNYFTIEIPTSFGVSERSVSVFWESGIHPAELYLNDTRIIYASSGNENAYDLLTASQLTPGNTHTIRIGRQLTHVGGLAILYRE